MTLLALVKWLAVPHWTVIIWTQGTIWGHTVENFEEVNPVKGFSWSSWLSWGRKCKAFRALSINIKSVVMQNENPVLSPSQTLLGTWSLHIKQPLLGLCRKQSLLHGWVGMFLAAVWLPLFTLAVGFIFWVRWVSLSWWAVILFKILNFWFWIGFPESDSELFFDLELTEGQMN